MDAIRLVTLTIMALPSPRRKFHSILRTREFLASAFDRHLLKAFQSEPTSLLRRKSTGKLV
jgi:hypothetical protein